jgi:glycosyltransferase involved in cell wall biosynthesis
MSDRVRVLHVCESTAGGVGTFIRDLAFDQLGRGYQPALAVPDSGAVVDDLAARGVRAFRWRARAQPGPWVALELGRLARVVREFDPALMHLHSSKAGLVGRLLVRRRRPTILQPHSWSFFARTGRIRDATLRWERFGSRWADVVLCVSEDERRLGIEEGVDARYRVLPNGIDLDAFVPPSPGDRAAARKSLGLGEEPMAISVGRLHRQKNQGALLDAWPSVRAIVPEARLVLLGDGPDREELERRAVEGVALAGQTRDVRTWLAAADVVAQPSRWEGLSLSLLEALAAARSVVVTDVPGMREVVVDGVGAVVAPDDTDALAGAVAARLGDVARADTEGAAGRARVEAHYDRREQFDGIAALYEELLGERRA